MTDEEDIEATKAPLIEHLIELRRRLIWSLLAIFVAFLVCFYFAKPIYNLLLFPYRLAARYWNLTDPRLAILVSAVVGGTPAYRQLAGDDSPRDKSGAVS